MQKAVRLVYPPQCVGCQGLVESDFGLCADCWPDVPFLSGLVCDQCGAPLLGEGGEAAQCDDCLSSPRPWSRGRAAAGYSGKARDLILSFKHNDRTDLAVPLGRWMTHAARPILREDMLVVPVPLHRWRLLKRRYNQAALLAGQVARGAGLDLCPDLLVRTRARGITDGMDVQERFAAMEGIISPHPRRAARVAGRRVLLIDDVMTTGATLSACARALRDAGAADVDVVIFARVAKDR